MNSTDTAAASAAPEEPEDSSTTADREGFTGTLPEFLAWLDDALVYGGVRIATMPQPNAFGREVLTVETVTGGYSSDEKLLGRVLAESYLSTFWQSTHRGGLNVYEVPAEQMIGSASEHDVTWLAPRSNVMFSFAGIRVVSFEDADGHLGELSYTEAGVEGLFFEADEDGEALLVLRPRELAGTPYEF